jgi:hypothetical protein
MNTKGKKQQTVKAGSQADSEDSEFKNEFPRTFNPSDSKDLARFETACTKLYKELKKDCDSWNYPSYHACCNSFSKKRVASADIFHSESKSLGTWLEYHKIKDPADFPKAMLDLVKERKDKWFTLPGLNLSHGCDYPREEDEAKTERATEMLKKRAAKTEAALDTANRRIAELEQLLEAEKKARKQDELAYGLCLIKLKNQGRLLPGPEPHSKPMPMFLPMPKFDRSSPVQNRKPAK